MRPTSLVSILGLVIVGVIIADFLTHGTQTKQAAQGIVSIEKPGLNALLGKTSP